MDFNFMGLYDYIFDLSDCFLTQL